MNKRIKSDTVEVNFDVFQRWKNAKPKDSKDTTDVYRRTSETTVRSEVLFIYF